MDCSDLRGKRLLLVGGVGPTHDLIGLAHRNGVFLGVTDYNKNTRVKRDADAAYDVDAIDPDALADLYRREGYDGIMTSFSDILSPILARVAETVGAPTPFTVEQLRLSTDKRFFKQKCIEYGVPVPKEYELDPGDEETFQRAELPIIVKPVDGNSSKGITICHTRDELRTACATALAASRCGRVIAEQYLPYDEINVTYVAQDGDIRLAAIHDRYFSTEQNTSVKVPDMYIYPSRYTAMYLEKYNDAVIGMLRGMGIRNGPLFLQACVRDDRVYFYEAGIRLNGCKTYQILEVENGYNTFERLMRFHLTGSMGPRADLDPRFRRWYATWNVIARPGAVVDRYVDLEELEREPWLIHVGRAYYEGDTVPPTSGGTLTQLIARIHLYGDTKEELLRRIAETQERFRVLDPEGRSVLLTPHDVEDLRAKLDYELFDR